MHLAGIRTDTSLQSKSPSTKFQLICSKCLHHYLLNWKTLMRNLTVKNSETVLLRFT